MMARKILFVIPSLEPSGPAKQLTLLATGLPRDRFEPRVCVLSRLGSFAEPLRAAGVIVDALGWNRLFDLHPFFHLRTLVQSFGPEVIHVWDPLSWRALGLLIGRRNGRGSSSLRIVASSPFTKCPGRLGRAAVGVLPLLDWWLLRRTDWIVASGPAEAERCRRLGLPEGKIVIIHPGVERKGEGENERQREGETGKDGEGERSSQPVFASSLRLSVSPSRFLACVGPLEAHKGFRDAIWAFDILKYLYDDLHLLLVGTGSDQARLQHFAHALGAQDRVHFLGPQTDVPGLLAQSEVVWVPSRNEGGVNVALEAMAAGRPVVAARQPQLAEVVVEGETGFLVTPGDNAALARQTRQLLDDADRRREMGEAGRKRVYDHFPAAKLVQHFTSLYSSSQ